MFFHCIFFSFVKRQQPTRNKMPDRRQNNQCATKSPKDPMHPIVKRTTRIPRTDDNCCFCCQPAVLCLARPFLASSDRSIRKFCSDPPSCTILINKTVSHKARIKSAKCHKYEWDSLPDNFPFVDIRSGHPDP